MPERLKTPQSEPIESHPTSFGSELKRIRKSKKISIRLLDEYTGVDHTTISRLEALDRKPQLETAVLLAMGLNLSPEERLMLYESVITDEQMAGLRGGNYTPEPISVPANPEPLPEIIENTTITKII